MPKMPQSTNTAENLDAPLASFLFCFLSSESVSCPPLLTPLHMFNIIEQSEQKNIR